MVCNVMAHDPPDDARARSASQIMLGAKQQCLDTVERYRKVGVTHFIFMMFAPYFRTRSRRSQRR